MKTGKDHQRIPKGTLLIIGGVEDKNDDKMPGFDLGERKLAGPPINPRKSKFK
jgi:hypothetical protein